METKLHNRMQVLVPLKSYTDSVQWLVEIDQNIDNKSVPCEWLYLHY